MKLNEIIEKIMLISSEDFAEEWDNGGIQIDAGNTDIKKILIALEITDDVVDEAIEKNIDMIITHHPFIFSPLTSIQNNWIGKTIVRLIQNKITVYSCHTSFDSSVGGNNDYLADLLGIKTTEVLSSIQEDILGEKPPSGLGRIGFFTEPITLKQACLLIKNKLMMSDPISYTGSEDQMINKVALCTGSGADFIEEASKKGCQLYITGDIRYHDAQLARQLDLSLIDATHFHTEKIFTKNLYDQLKSKTENEVQIYPSQMDINPFHFL